MRRREFMAGVAGLLGLHGAASAQTSHKPIRIGMLETLDKELNAQNLRAFNLAMRERGYIEGESYLLEYRSAGGRNDLFDALAVELLQTKVDLIITRGTPAARSAKKATKTVPIVMAAIGEPLALVDSLASPGGNVTGLTALSRELAAKRMSLLKETVPELKRVGALLNLSNPTLQADWVEVKRTAGAAAMDAILLDVRSKDDILGAFERGKSDAIDCLVVSNDSLTQTNFRLIVDLAVGHKLPASFASREFVEAGGLMSYSVSYPDLYRRAATYVDKILKGAKPAELPIEQPTKFEMVINLNTAKTLGLTIPPLILAQADELIE